MVQTTSNPNDENPSVVSFLTSGDYNNVAYIGSSYNPITQCFIAHHKPLREPTWFTIKDSITVNWWKIDSDDWHMNSTGSNQQDELFSKFYMLQPHIERDRYIKRFSYPYPSKKNSYILFYSFISRNSVLSLRPYLASLFFSPDTFEKLNVEESHMVHSMKSGIEVLFTISKRSDQISNKQIIGLLDKICSILRRKLLGDEKLDDSDQKIWSDLNIQYQINSCVADCKLPQDIRTIIYQIKSMETLWFSYEHPIEYKFKPVQWIQKITTEYPSHIDDDEENLCFEGIRQKLLKVNNAFHKLAAFIEEGHEKISSSDQKSFDENFQAIKEKRLDMLQQVWRSYQNIGEHSKKVTDLYDTLSSKPYNDLCILIEEFQKKCDAFNIGNSSSESLTTTQQNENEKLPFVTLHSSVQESTEPSTSSDASVLSIEREEQNFENEVVIDTRLTHHNDSAVVSSESIPTDRTDKDYNQLNNKSNSNVEVVEISEESKSTSTIQTPAPKASRQPVTHINILLIGQSGVGKSTFINAFVNYLAFETFDKAKHGEPIALIPVSFLMTYDFDFKETTIKFGMMDANENYDHPGQSVTQECRSYVFKISENLHLRIIDTPGIGDTRGIKQDEKNIDQILSSLSRFSHINAICILLRPNITRMDVFFRFCIQRIFSYLSANARDNIVFGFTNVRSTFYSIGNTGPILRKFLETLAIKGIPYGKKNSFLFDSESFRYLACIKNGFMFESDEEEAYKNSWIKAVPESIRFFKYIQSLKPYEIHRWQSAGHAKIQIQMLVKPMMEALRTLLINQALVETGDLSWLRLTVKRIDHPNVIPAICYQCSDKKISIGLISIKKYHIHNFEYRISDGDHQCEKCGCAFADHELVDYEIDYAVESQGQTSQSELDKDVKTLNNLIHMLGPFIQPANPYLVYYNHLSDPQILSEQNSLTEIVNGKLCELKQHLENIPQWPDDQDIDLTNIYEKIEQAKSLPLVKIQLEAIEHRQELMQQHTEKFIDIPKDTSEMLAKLTEEN